MGYERVCHAWPQNKFIAILHNTHSASSVIPFVHGWAAPLLYIAEGKPVLHATWACPSSRGPAQQLSRWVAETLRKRSCCELKSSCQAESDSIGGTCYSEAV